MYLPKEYSSALYYHLQRKGGLKAEAKALDPQNGGHDWHARRSLLEKMHVKIKKLSPYSKKLLNKDISAAMSALLRGKENQEPSEIRMYLKKYRSRFEADKRNGVLEKMVLGNQLELNLKGSHFSNVSSLHEKPSREDAMHYFRTRKN